MAKRFSATKYLAGLKLHGLSGQPDWECIAVSDFFRIQKDKTGENVEEAEVAEEIEDSDDDNKRFMVFRFPLDRLKEVKGYLVPMGYTAKDYPHSLKDYEPWFMKDLEVVADGLSKKESELREAFCSKEPMIRFFAYLDVGHYHGMANLDSYPLDLSEEKLDERWSGPCRGKR